MDKHTVTALVRQYTNGDREAITPILQAIRPWILATIGRSNIPNGVDREDIYSEILVEIISDIESYDPEAGELTTFVKCKCRRIPRIIKRLSPMPEATTEVIDYRSVASDLDGETSLITGSGLTDFQVLVTTLYIKCGSSIKKTTEQTNHTFIMRHGSAFKTRFSRRAIQATIEESLRIIKYHLDPQ